MFITVNQQTPRSFVFGSWTPHHVGLLLSWSFLATVQISHYHLSKLHHQLSLSCCNPVQYDCSICLFFSSVLGSLYYLLYCSSSILTASCSCLNWDLHYAIIYLYHTSSPDLRILHCRAILMHLYLHLEVLSKQKPTKMTLSFPTLKLSRWKRVNHFFVVFCLLLYHYFQHTPMIMTWSSSIYAAF